MRKLFKLVLLYTVRALGFFALSRRLTRHGLRLLCYHGIALDDEHRFRPGLFMRPETFRRRLKTLAAGGYPVLKLSDALARLRTGTLPPAATVLTVDDGAYSTFLHQIPAARDFSYPITVYVTTYYAVKRGPVFRLVVQYMFWKTARQDLDITGLAPGLSGVRSLVKAQVRENLCWEIIDFAERQLSEAERENLLCRLGKRLGVDYEVLDRRRSFHIMTESEIRAAAGSGVDIQLHTHRHRLPVVEAAVHREIAENRDFLEPLTGESALVHFCYPSGFWSKEHWPWLTAAGVVSATTCDPGFNYPDSPPLALNRILDSELVSDIEFEAELTGFIELWRRLKRSLRMGRRTESMAESATTPVSSAAQAFGRCFEVSGETTSCSRRT